MTFQEKFEELYQDFALKSDEYLKANAKLSSVNGFFPKDLLDDLEQKKLKWQDAGNNYHHFMNYFQKSGKKVTDEYPEKE